MILDHMTMYISPLSIITTILGKHKITRLQIFRKRVIPMSTYIVLYVIKPIKTIFIENKTVRTKEILKRIEIKSLLQNTAIKRL